MVIYINQRGSGRDGCGAWRISMKEFGAISAKIGSVDHELKSDFAGRANGIAQ
jgi:hypothetical protein